MLATVRGVWQYRDLVRHLVHRDLRLRYKGSALGVAWSLVNPLVLAAVYTFAFAYVIKLQIERFPVFLLLGLLPWTFFTGALGHGTGAVADNAPLVRKVRFPRAVLPVASTLSQFVMFALAYAVFVPASLALGTTLSAAWLTVPAIMALQLAFTTGLALLAATAYVYFRDIRHLIDVAIQFLFWLTPIVYSVDLVPARLRTLVMLNPLAAFLTAYRDAILHGRVSPPLVWVVMGVATLVAAALGLYVFSRRERRFGELV
jgi:ABC-type polysaccharide/polyol phosphate export permease